MSRKAGETPPRQRADDRPANRCRRTC